MRPCRPDMRTRGDAIVSILLSFPCQSTTLTFSYFRCWFNSVLNLLAHSHFRETRVENIFAPLKEVSVRQLGICIRACALPSEWKQYMSVYREIIGVLGAKPELETIVQLQTGGLSIVFIYAVIVWHRRSLQSIPFFVNPVDPFEMAMSSIPATADVIISSVATTAVVNDFQQALDKTRFSAIYPDIPTIIPARNQWKVASTERNALRLIDEMIKNMNCLHQYAILGGFLSLGSDQSPGGHAVSFTVCNLNLRLITYYDSNTSRPFQLSDSDTPLVSYLADYNITAASIVLLKRADKLPSFEEFMAANSA